MRIRAVLAASAMAVLLASETPALAQQPMPRGFLEIEGAANLAAPAAVTQDRQFTQFLELAEIKSVVQQKRGSRIGARAGWWLTPRVGLAGGVSVLRASGTIQATYAFPSPFVFDMPVSARATVPATRTSTDTEIDVIFSLADGHGWHLTAGAGPDVARVTQPLLADVLAASYAFPFTSIDLTPVSGQSRGTAVGVHMMGTISRHLGQHLDVTATVDYRHAPVQLTTIDGTVTANAGGTTAGGGLRVRF